MTWLLACAKTLASGDDAGRGVWFAWRCHWQFAANRMPLIMKNRLFDFNLILNISEVP